VPDHCGKADPQNISVENYLVRIRTLAEAR
jgi:hypothetical protein